MKQDLFTTVFFFLFFFSLTIHAQDGSFDTNFGANGILTLPVGNGNSDNLSSVLMHPDGRLTLGGYSRTGIPLKDKFYISRILTDGTFDPTFNGGVSKTFSDSANFVGVFIAARSDGGIMYAGSRGPYKLATGGRLNADGSDVVSPVGPYPIASSSATVSHTITSMSYNKSTDKVLIGGYMSSAPYPMIGYQLRSDLSLDGNFSGDGRINFGSIGLVYSFDVLSLEDGSAFFASNLSYGGTFAVTKLRPNGMIDSTFGINGIFSTNIDPSYGEPRKMLLQPDGKILLCGGAAIGSGRFTIIRIHSDGSLDNSFVAPQIATSGSNNYFTSMILQPDGKIIASGISSPFTGGGSTGVIMRFKDNGTVDSTFGTDGKVAIPNFVINASDVSILERKAVFVGKNSSGQMTIVKLRISSQPFNILGKNIVSVETESKYKIHPVIPGNTYVWNYSSSNIYTLGSSIDDTLTLYFTKTTPSGTLSCSVYDAFGNLLKKVDKAITVNPEPTLAQQLTDTECSSAQSYTSEGSINSFLIRQTKVSSVNTGASASGYDDLTSSSNYDTLYIGDNYQASLECLRTTTNPLYCGIWVDLDNNGKMNDFSEFLGSTVSENNSFTVNNMIIPVDAATGPKRMRVRIRQSAPFTAEEFCIENEESSETEDYLVVVAYYQGIKAPNFITPNNDGRNDNFVVRGVKEGLNNNLKIFNRVGDLVFDADNYENTWSGQDKNGGLLKAGTYFFVFTQVSTENSKDDVVKGFFEIRY
jgi:gliding motility-associated-like protein/uncharacterized delta-60 repeat protein